MDSEVLAEERLLGSKIPISCSSLNRDFGLDLNASQQCLSKLYQNNQDALNAYTCETSSDVTNNLKTTKLSLKLCSPGITPNSIHLLTPKGQALTYAYSLCFNNSSTTSKKHSAGIPIPNPMLARIAEQPAKPAEPIKEVKEVQEAEQIKEVKEVKEVKESKELKKQEVKPVQAAPTKKPAAKSKPAGPWKTMSKEEAKAQALKKSTPVVNEKVVIADHNEVQSSQPEENEKDSEARKKQLESLNNLFDQDDTMEVDAGESDDAMELDTDTHDEPVEQEEQELVLEPEEKPKPEPERKSEPEPKPEPEPEVVPATQNKKLVEEIRHREEDGMTVSYRVKVWRDASTGEEVDEPPNSHSVPATAKSTKPKPEPTPNLAKPAAKRPTGRAGGKSQTQQKKLTSFFKK